MMSTRGFHNKDAISNSQNKPTALNPNAAEFVPSSLKSLPGNARNVEVSRLDVPISSGKAVLDRSGSNASNNSDDEAHQYWRHQLPDDITPDFKVMGENDLQMVGGLSLSGLSIHNGTGASQFGVSGGSNLSGKQESLSVHGLDDIRLSGSMRYNVLGCGGDQTSPPFTNLASSQWSKHFINGDHPNGLEEVHYTGSSNTGFLNELVNDHNGINNISMNPLEFLASEFPGFAAESLAEIYYRNECDLNLTMEILAQLEFQVDGGFNQNLNLKASAPSLNPLDFPVLPISDSQNGLSKYSGEDVHRASNSYEPVEKGSYSFTKHRSSGTPRGALDFASAVRKLASQDSGHRKYERNGSADMNVGSSRGSQNLASSYNGHGKSTYTDKLQGIGTTHAAPLWLETGDAVGNMYSESREEARDFARLRNAYFEQARQAYIIGNKALAKDLSAKGQFLNMQMKAAHEKARDNIYRQRNPVSSDIQSYGRGQDPLIDLHGLHVSEAIHVLRHELNILRRTARSAGQRLQVMICVGTGHHTKGSRTPARLPVAVEQYLLDEGLQYSEPQPGLLRVVLY